MTNTRRMEDGNVRFSMTRKGQYSRIEFCVNLAFYLFISYNTVKDVPL